MFFKMYIRTYLSSYMYHLSIFMFHAYSGIMLVCNLLSTLKGTKGPFIFIKVKKKIPEIICTECTKVEGTLQ